MPAPPPTVDDRDRVVLRVPADPRYARVVRVAVSAYAVRLGLAPAAIEDLRLAVDEALILLMGSTSASGNIDGDGETNVVVTLDAETDRPPLTVGMCLEPPPASSEPDLRARSRFEEIIPSNVTVEAVDQATGAVTLRHPG